MNKALDENAQMEVEVNDIRATAKEVDNFKSIITQSLGNNGTTPTVTTTGVELYDVNFKVINPKIFKLESVVDWLKSSGIVGHNIRGTLVP
jgi:hypothetical protein